MNSISAPVVPKAAHITVALSCNNDCVFCYNRDRRPLSEPLGEQRVLDLVEEASDAGSVRLSFLGGEVTILPYFLRVLTSAGRRFDSVGIGTNARRFKDPIFAAECAAAGLTDVDVSLHGSTAAVHDATTRAKGSFDETIAGLRNLVSLGRGTDRFGPVSLSVTTLVLASNYLDLPAIGRFIHDLGVRKWRIKYAFGSLDAEPGEPGHDYIPRYRTTMPLIRQALVECARKLDIVVHDVPLCLLGDLMPYSTGFLSGEGLIERSDGTALAVELVDGWGITTDRCKECAGRTICGRPSPTYTALYGDEELEPFDPKSWTAAVRRGRAFCQDVQAGAAQAVPEARSETVQKPQPDGDTTSASDLQAAFSRIHQAATERRWMDVRTAALAALALRPNHPEALRMQRTAELHMLHAEVNRLAESGDRGRAQKVRRYIHRHYADLEHT